MNGESLSLRQEVDLPSDDSDDDDYNPDKIESSCSTDGEGIENNSLDSTTVSTSLDWCSDSEVKSGFRLSDTDIGVLDFDETIDPEILCGRRQRSVVDYIKLNAVSILTLSRVSCSSDGFNEKGISVIEDCGY